MDAVEEIRELLRKRIEALRVHDAKAANAALDKCVVAFEVAGPLQLPAQQATDAAATQTWLDSFDEGPFVSVNELTIYADAGVGYCHSLNRLYGRGNDRRAIDLTMRSTLGLRKTNAGWVIVHAHTSLPR